MKFLETFYKVSYACFQIIMEITVKFLKSSLFQMTEFSDEIHMIWELSKKFQVGF